MGSLSSDKPHAVCVPFPAQGHMNSMLKLAKVLHSMGFYITFVNTEFNHRRILRTRGPAALQGLPDFRFETIPDGLPPAADEDTARDRCDVPALCMSIHNNCFVSFRELISKLNSPSSLAPPVTCIVSDNTTSFTLEVAAELGIPDVFYCSASACGLMGILHYKHLVEKGIVPFKNESDLTNKAYLDTPIDWIPGMKNVRLRDLPTLLRTTDPEDVLFNFLKAEAEESYRATAMIINTFDDLEGPVLDAMSKMLSPIYTIGPLALLSNQIMPESPLIESVGLNLWKEDPGCLEWLEGRAAGSVVYVNYGSTAIMTNEQLLEFAWGLANSGYDFLWVIRPDLVRGDSALLPEEFSMETGGRSKLASWCPQEAVLSHPAIGCFLTHCGWNSTMDSMCAGVPMVCWPFFADQQTNCRYLCTEWGVGLEINNQVRREEVEALLRELIEGEKGMEMKRRVLEWKESAVKATRPGGRSFVNLQRMVKEVLLRDKNI